MTTVAPMLPTIADYIICGIILLSIVISLIRGFAREALSLASWGLSLWVAFTYYTVAAPWLENLIASPALRHAAAFLLLLCVMLILCAIINYIICQFIERTGLSGTDRAIGSIFGFVRGTLLVAVLLLLVSSTALTKDEWWQKSLLIPHFTPLETWILSLLPDSVNTHFNKTSA